jgi:membrane-associated phospholipid phosphatase
MSIILGSPAESDIDPIPLREFQQTVLKKGDIERGFELDDSPISLFAPQALEQPVCILQVTIRKPLTKGSIAAIMWSLFPYAVPVFSVLSFIRHALTAARQGDSIVGGYSGFLFFYICLAIFGVLLNEKVLKRLVQEPRPAASACKGYGMPSGHSTNCYAWMVWMVVEILSHPSASGWFTIFLICLTIFVMGPVPYARVYLQDHTPKQVLVGMVVGSIIGLIAAPIRLWLLAHATPLWL